MSEQSKENKEMTEDELAYQALEAYRVRPETSVLISKKSDRETLQKFEKPWAAGQPAYGALPHFDERDEIIRHFAKEAKYFGKHYRTGKGPSWRDSLYAEGTILFEMKFGKRLSEFAEEILAQYPDLEKKGREVSLFGLSGSGKSAVVEMLREQLDRATIFLDSDTVRYNLLGKMVKDVETRDGTSMKGKEHLIHNSISGSLYYLLNYVTKELRDRGYQVIQSSTLPTSDADITIYIEHPDGIDPRILSDEQIPDVARTLYNRTQSRVHGADNFDWEHAQTVIDFNAMKSVTVQVPELIHARFLTNVRAALQDVDTKGIRILKNPHTDDPVERKNALLKQLKGFLI